MADNETPNLAMLRDVARRLEPLLPRLAFLGGVVAELFFTDALWPDFNAEILAEAIEDFRGRERRFGLTGKQVRQEPRS